ncbi:MAG TPA: hypothetical protein VGO86_00545 [Candidatus Dormibacteraeota bacterium]
MPSTCSGSADRTTFRIYSNTSGADGRRKAAPAQGQQLVVGPVYPNQPNSRPADLSVSFSCG